MPFRALDLAVVLFVSSVLLGCGARDELVSTPFGDFRTTFVELSYLAGRQPTEADVAGAIARRFPARDDPELPTPRLGAKIARVSRCFGLDAAMLTGLVRQESAFDRKAVSRTGASGLTQFTTIGVREVNDQLGERGSEHGRAAAIRYFNDVIAGCAERDVLDARWRHLWHRAPESLRAMRDVMRGDADVALVYGGVLLKTLLSVARTRHGDVPMEVLYKEALERYNGDPDPAVRDDYWRRIFRYAQETRAEPRG